MFRVRSREAAESATTNSSGDTLVDVKDNFSRFAKQSGVARYGRRMSVNERSTRLMFGANGIQAFREASDNDVWRSFTVRSAGREKSPVFRNSARSRANAASVYSPVRARASRTRDVIEPSC
jgi:hypothetical protein